MRVFLDSNIPMYAAGREHANRAPALQLLDRVRRGKLDACTSTEVLQEILHRYRALSRLDLAGEVYDSFVEICPVVLNITLADTDRARDLVCRLESISTRDAVHAAVMLNHKIESIATFDKDFDNIPGIRRWKMSGE